MQLARWVCDLPGEFCRNLSSLASGSAAHNVSAAELCFYGGELPQDTPEEYRTYIEDMRTSFELLDGFITMVDSKTEEEKSLDEIRVSLNVYSNYDCATGQVCDELEVDLHRADGRDESLSYTLNAAEKEILLRKMDAYCQEQTGQTLAGYSARLMAEDLAPPTAPSM